MKLVSQVPGAGSLSARRRGRREDLAEDLGEAPGAAHGDAAASEAALDLSGDGADAGGLDTWPGRKMVGRGVFLSVFHGVFWVMLKVLVFFFQGFSCFFFFLRGCVITL